MLVLAIPFEFSFHYVSQEQYSSEFKLVWLFGLLKTRFTSQKKTHKKRLVKQEKRKGRPDIRVLARIVRINGLLNHLKRFVSGILSRLKIKRLSVDLTISFDSPADTAFLFAFSSPFNYFMNTCLPWDITITPHFYNEAYFKASIDGRLRLIPVMLIIPLVRLLFGAPFLRAAVVLVKEWKRKR